MVGRAVPGTGEEAADHEVPAQGGEVLVHGEQGLVDLGLAVLTVGLEQHLGEVREERLAARGLARDRLEAPVGGEQVRDGAEGMTGHAPKPGGLGTRPAKGFHFGSGRTVTFTASCTFGSTGGMPVRSKIGRAFSTKARKSSSESQKSTTRHPPVPSGPAAWAMNPRGGHHSAAMSCRWVSSYSAWVRPGISTVTMTAMVLLLYAWREGVPISRPAPPPPRTATGPDRATGDRGGRMGSMSGFFDSPVPRRVETGEYPLWGEALALVNRDLAVTLPDQEPLRLQGLPSRDGGEDIYVALANGEWQGNCLDPSTSDDPVSAVEAVADAAQETVVELLWQAWPVCGEHGIGMHPHSADGQIGWWCSGGRTPREPAHVPAAVGALDSLVRPHRPHRKQRRRATPPAGSGSS
ncbi:hypothetical protein BN2537_7863 [Streptomyces venezuelae]|nr:hypothetical protein BN2537_7863 [Streptomyces venezuelae]